MVLSLPVSEIEVLSFETTLEILRGRGVLYMVFMLVVMGSVASCSRSDEVSPLAGSILSFTAGLNYPKP